MIRTGIRIEIEKKKTNIDCKIISGNETLEPLVNGQKAEQIKSLTINLKLQWKL